MPTTEDRPRSSALRWGAVALAGVLVLGVWWWNGREERVTSAPAPTTPTTTTTLPDLPADVAELWRILDDDGAWIALDRPDPLQVPGPDFPAGADLTGLVWPPTSTRPVSEWPEKHEAAQTLYVERAAEHPWNGRAVMVGRGAAAVDAPGLVEGGEAVTVAATPGRIEQRGDVWIVAWQVPVDAEGVCDECTQEAFVAARGVDRDSVIAMANAADVLGTPPQLLLETIPSGLSPLSSVPLAVGDGLPAAASEDVDVSVDGSPVSVRLLDGDPRLTGHLAFWGGAEGTAWRTPSVLVVERPTGVAVVSPPDVDAATAVALVEGLVDGTEAEAQQVADSVG